MVNRRYFLVVLDPTGRSVRRFGVARRSIEIAAGLTLVTLAIVLSLVMHGMVRTGAAKEAEELAQENAVLAQVADQIEARLAAGRMLSLRAELTFAQLYAKSGLALEPRMLGIGPLEEQVLPSIGGDTTTGFAEPRGHLVLAVAPAALPLELDRMEQDGQALQTSLGEMLEYFHDANLLVSNTPSVRPVSTGYLTSSFGKRRDPMNKNWVMHKGLDIGGHEGLEIFAPADGVIISTGPRGGYGQTIVVDQGYGLQTHYAHLSRIRCKNGERVSRGDVIGEMGSTGRSTGPHLHYEVRRLGVPINPLRFILD